VAPEIGSLKINGCPLSIIDETFRAIPSMKYFQGKRFLSIKLWME
jgi:hypothetical protein